MVRHAAGRDSKMSMGSCTALDVCNGYRTCLQPIGSIAQWQSVALITLWFRVRLPVDPLEENK